MRLTELFIALNEKPVESTWITDISYNRPNRVLTMRLSNGTRYSIPGISRGMFEKWANASSKGQFFHRFIKGRYNVKRL
jgi:hypothetical protein